VRCHGCGATGDALSLIAAQYGLGLVGDDFRQVLIRGAEFAGLQSLVRELEGDEPAERPPPIVRAAPEPERDYPPQAEVDALWASTPAALDADCEAWAASRSLDPELLATEMGGHTLARCLPAAGDLPWWASYQRRSWRETGHRILVPVFDHMGVRRSVRAIRVTEDESPKRLPPGGHRASGVVLACAFGLAMLQGTFDAKHVMILEGEPDLLSWATSPADRPYARLGIISGSWTDAFAARIPKGARVYLRTHDDDAGRRYADAIRATMPGHKFFKFAKSESR
jgi:hypothetical protein